MITPSGPYVCGKSLQTTKNPELPGYKNYSKTACGPMTLIEEKAYRYCTLNERAGASSGYSSASKIMSSIVQNDCARGNNITYSKRLELIDKGGRRFQLGSAFNWIVDKIGESDFSEDCTSMLKTTTSRTSYTVGEARIKITTELVSAQGIRKIAQPSL